MEVIPPYSDLAQHPNNITSTSQQFFMLGSGANANLEALGGSETDAQTIWPSGSITLLWCRVKTAARGTSTVRLRHNGANGNNTFSIGSGQTGAFSDSTPHTDTITNGDSVNVGITAGSDQYSRSILVETVI